MSVVEAATTLFDRERFSRDGDPLTATWRTLGPGLAYAVQTETLRHRLADGQRITGVKLGLTSAARQRAMGVDAPLTGWLTDAMELDHGMPVRLSRFIRPRAEPEIVFVMGRRLAGPGVTPEAALACVAEVRAGIEVIDSRYRGFRSTLPDVTLPDVIADNASSAGYRLGTTALPPDALDLAAESCRLQIAGAPAGTAAGAAVLGDPARALALAANDLAARGHAIEAGWIVLTGGLHDAVRLTPGTHVRAAFTTLGTVSLTTDCLTTEP